MLGLNLAIFSIFLLITKFSVTFVPASEFYYNYRVKRQSLRHTAFTEQEGKPM